MSTAAEIQFKCVPLAAFAWPGGYPLYYLDDEHNTLCPECANKPGYNSLIIDCDINYEDATLYCDDCSGRIESAYAEDDVEGNE